MPAWLSPAGTLSALAIGASVWFGIGWRGVALLFVFLISSSLLTPGGGQRRPIQVLANGGCAALGALATRLDPLFLFAFVGAVSAAAADTWSSEIGRRSPAAPRLITTWQRVTPGVSGGVTALGTLGGVAGAAAIGLAAWLLRLQPVNGVLVVLVAGVGGMLVDSLFGALLQARWQCPTCGAVAETPTPCHGPVTLLRGLRWMTNDTVNAVATVSGAVFAALPAILDRAHLA